MRQKGFAAIFAILLIAVFGIVAYFLLFRSIPPKVICTQEMKQCPDGSYVSRGGLRCEFADCSGIIPPNSTSLSSYVDPSKMFSIGYPAEWEVREQNNAVTFYPSLNGLTQPKQMIKVSYFDLGKKDLLSFILDGGLGENYASYLKGSDSTLFSETDEISGYKVYRPKEWPSIGLSETRFVISENKLVYINFDPMEPDTGDLFNQILTTLKFTK